MKVLFLLIALYTVSGKQVVTEGSVPDGSSCVYEQSGTKSGQMTAGNTIDMTWTGYDGATIHSVTLMMRSNTSAGAGALQMQVGGRTVWQIADAAFKETSWNGAYSAEFVPIEHSFNALSVPDGAVIGLHLSASVNSLYLQSVQINYSLPAAQPCTVRFDTHISIQVSSMTEASAGAGIVLPEFQIYDADWQFNGWVEQPVIETNLAPMSVYPAGSLYHPSKNCTMHALYVHEGDEPVWYAADSIGTDAYVMSMYIPAMDDQSLLRAYGAVDNGRLALRTVSAWTADDEVLLPTTDFKQDEVYNLKRSTDTTVTICHASTGKFVTLGQNNKFTTSTNATRHWRVTPYASANAPRGAFSLWQVMDGVTYYVGLQYMSNTYEFYLKPTTELSAVCPLLFYSTTDIDREPSVYTSYPYGNGVGLTTPDGIDRPVYTIDFGTYQLRIHNGTKTIQLK